MDGRGAVESGEGDKAMPISKKKVGGIYHCEKCNDEYVARTVWQKFCPTCGAKRDKEVRLARSISKRKVIA
jgi:Zn finger protein HypA/HybF involved in hydrogenase expression